MRFISCWLRKDGKALLTWVPTTVLSSKRPRPISATKTPPSATFTVAGAEPPCPHKRLPDTEGWQIQSDHTSLIVEPGMRLGPAGRPVPVGIPYGSRAKLILIFLQTEAIRTQSREIELGGSLRAWLTKLGITVSGPSASAVRDQAERISRCRLTFQVQKGSALGLVNQNIVDEALFLETPDEGQASMFLNTAKLSEGFFAQLKRHPVPLEEAAIKQLSNNSMALGCLRLAGLSAAQPTPPGAGAVAVTHGSIRWRISASSSTSNRAF